MRCLTLTFAFCFGLATTAGATLIERDLYVPGDGLLTYDDVNRREWLDITETLDWSIDALQEAMGPTGSLSGFKLARIEDVVAFAVIGQVSLYPTIDFPGSDGSAAWDLINLTGEQILWEEASEEPGFYCWESDNGLSCGVDYDDLHESNILEVLGLRLAAGFAVANDGSAAIENLGIVGIFSYGNPADGINRPIFSGEDWFVSGGVAVMTADDLSIELPIGPYWLYRTVPEPSTLGMLLLCSGLISRRADYVLC